MDAGATEGIAGFPLWCGCSKRIVPRSSRDYVTVIVIVLLVPPHRLAETVVLPAATGVPVPPVMVRTEVLPTFQVT